MTYKTALETLAGRDSRKIANNTVLRRYAENLSSDPAPDAVALRLHSTDILTFHRDGSVTATSGSWKTPTTKDRLNSYLPHGWGIHQAKGVWYWSRRELGRHVSSFAPGSGTLFTDGDRIDPSGGLLAQAARPNR